MSSRMARPIGLGIVCLFVFNCLLLSGLRAQTGYPELPEKITLQLNNTDAATVIRELVRQAGTRSFLFDGNLLKDRKIAQVQYKALELGKVLQHLKTNHGLEFTVKENYIVVKLLPLPVENNTKPVAAAFLWKGTVIDSITNQPLAGASLLIRGTKTGTITDQQGAFSLSSKDPSGTLQVYYMGYQQAEYHFDTLRMNITVSMAPSANYLSSVTVRSKRHLLQPVQHTKDRELIQEIKLGNSVVSGISSEQIAKLADVNAAQIARRIAGVTLTDEQFLVVRGMNQRYNVTYLGDNIAPSTEQYSRAFAMSLLPSRIIDKIMVYKSPRADLFGDFAGAVVKVYTKDALAVKHFDVGVRVGYLPNSTGKVYNSYKGGKLDWLGIDDGYRALPSSVPGYGDFRKAELSQKDFVQSFSPTLSYETKRAIPDLQLTLNYYNSFKLGNARLYNISGIGYTSEVRSFDVQRQTNNTYSSYTNSNTKSTYTTEEQSSEEVTLNGMQNFLLRINDNHKIYFRNFALQQGRKGTIDRIQRPNTIPDSLGRIGNNQSYWNRQVVLDYRERFLYAGNIGGTHNLFAAKHQLNWNLGITTTKNETPDQRVSRFVNNDFPMSNYNLGESKDFDLNWRADDRLGKAVSVYDREGSIARVFMKLNEEVYNASLDYTIDLKPWLELKAGTYQLFKQRDVARRLFVVYDGELTDGNKNNLIQINEGSFYKMPGSLQYVDPALWRFNLHDLDKVWSTDYFREDGSGLRVEDRTGPMDAYKASEQYNAGYIMTTARPFNGKLELDAGLRLEYNQVKLTAVVPSLVLPDERVGPTILIDRSRLSWLPSFNASWRPNDAWVLRAAYGKTVNRPEFREISPFRDYDYPNNQMINGNPALVQSAISNYDLRLEFYPQKNKNEMFSIGFFYKELKDPIEKIIFSANTADAEISAYDNINFVNAADATVKGIEVDARKNLGFIPGKLFKNLSVLLNAAIIHSRVDGEFIATIPGSGTTFLDTAKNRPLQGQAPYVINAGLFYEDAKLGSKFSLSYNVSGTSIYAVGKYTEHATSLLAYRGSILELARHLVDFAYTQQFAKRWQAKFSINNILNEDFRFVEDQNKDNKYQKEYTTGNKVGARNAPEYLGDNISRRWSPGRNIQASLTYSF